MRSSTLFFILVRSIFWSRTGVSSFLVLERAPVPTKANPRKVTRNSIKQKNYSKNPLICLRGGEGLSQNTEQWMAIEESETSILVGSEAYYLLWSPKFMPKLALATVILATFRRLGWDHRLFGILTGSIRFIPSGTFSNLILPLLSSSCCAIQIIVNAISVLVMGAGAGCIGFNTFLGPIRPYMLAVMVAYYTTQSSPSAMLVRYAIALMPEVVFAWNELVRLNWKRKNKSNAKVEGPMVKATIVVDVPTMGCVACVNKIESSLRNRAPDYVETATSWLNPKEKTDGGKKGGQAKIEVKAFSRDDLDNLAESLVGAIEDAGFHGATIKELEIQASSSSSNESSG